MHFRHPDSQLFVPDGLPAGAALARTTHLGIAAHQDDLEIMAWHGILACFGAADRWFTGAVVTNGSGSPRSDLYADYTDAAMMAVRRTEQRKAAVVGEYAAQAQLGYPSAAVKDAGQPAVEEDLRDLLLAAQPEVLYLHNLADKHDTHIAVAVRALRAVRSLPPAQRPARVLGCEVWRDLDWLLDGEKVALDVSGHENLALALLGVFDSQICGGKRYDLASQGRRRANATYHASHGVDAATALTFAMDLTPLAHDDTLDLADHAAAAIRRFADDTAARLRRLG